MNNLKLCSLSYILVDLLSSLVFITIVFLVNFRRISLRLYALVAFRRDGEICKALEESKQDCIECWHRTVDSKS